MTVLRRNRVIGLPKPKYNYVRKTTKKRYENIIIGKPVTPSNLTILMYDLYRQKNLTPKLKQITQYRMAKKFIQEVGQERAVELMMYCAEICKNVWTFKFMFALIKED